MVQGIWPLIFWGYYFPDMDLTYGVPIIILPNQIYLWYNGGFQYPVILPFIIIIQLQDQ